MENLTRRELGMELHHAELAIGIGRRAIRELQSQDPVDHEAIGQQREQVQTSRLVRNGLRHRLEAVRLAEAGSCHTWTPYLS